MQKNLGISNQTRSSSLDHHTDGPSGAVSPRRQSALEYLPSATSRQFRLKLVLLSLRLPMPFSKSDGLMRGVGGTSSSLFIRPPRLTESFTDFGNSDRLGVRAVTTFLADLRSVSLIVHSLFLATKNKTVLAMPTSATTTTTIITATNPPRDSSMLPELEPEAPAALPSAADPGAAPTVPAPGSSPCPLNELSVARGNDDVVVVAMS